ncbi:PaaI family thioesterase [Parvibaculum sp.]|uniref:PaaI family thioesterase n=1 Tax=Parvibaculum sp. TaxID=2024848 RepID=UPI003C71A84D
MAQDMLEMLKKIPVPFADYLGIELVRAELENVEARLLVKKELCTIPDILHGGAIMAFADTLGAVATFLNLPKGSSTTTIESKTNFLAAVPLGEVVHGHCASVHRGRKAMVWQTRITRADGKLAALVTQTQLVL